MYEVAVLSQVLYEYIWYFLFINLAPIRPNLPPVRYMKGTLESNCDELSSCRTARKASCLSFTSPACTDRHHVTYFFPSMSLAFKTLLTFCT